MKPTNEQGIELFKVCQDLTQMYLPIYLVRLDERTTRIYILAGQSFEVEILPNGRVRYL
ncbi:MULTISPECIES: DUF6888 family protein [Nostoc]|uniref:DUF6888 domain-containing protein n=1 Tax=Nostoc favosum CHAB5714 TaxID=2780399 RepID=A0ABS8I415_9NOSO|nr:hypothetical protein [Nostoc favosum]MCC5598928.1 hypothetical protein [Nostoc favosum CHAB5714]